MFGLPGIPLANPEPIVLVSLGVPLPDDIREELIKGAVGACWVGHDSSLLELSHWVLLTNILLGFSPVVCTKREFDFTIF